MMSTPFPRRLVAFLAALVVGVLAATVLSASPAAAKGKYKARITVSATKITLGGSVTISGVVRGAPLGKKVVLQALYPTGRWHKNAVGRTGNGGAVTFVETPTTTQKRIYRIYVPGTRKKRAGFSNRILVKVKKASTTSTTSTSAPTEKWYDLYDVGSYDDYAFDSVSSIRINGAYFTKSLKQYTHASSGYEEYNLSRLCTQLTATVGLADDYSDSGSKGQLRILRDSSETYKKQFGLGVSEPITLDLTNTLRLRIETTDLSGWATVALGSPRIYCNTSIEQGWDD
ncbi:NPCBM/NEW2 domain-containing protein [Nocardioides sp.]|uniref:NPCBM/NEW2 domain-containing protein n=1 Tax=Nocardioides sp. TaxID=35761 RepID=UPI0039E478AD